MSETKFNLSIPGAIIVAGVIIAGAVIYQGGGDINSDQEAQIADTELEEATIDDDTVLGDSGAPVTIIEFSDYQCPFCRVFWGETLPSLKEQYIDTGKVKFVYRDFPLSAHPMALPYAMATECADEQGGFWEMHDKIFEEQQKYGDGTVTALTSEDIFEWVADLELNVEAFGACMEAGTYQEEIAKDFEDGVKTGVEGTPTFFVNGQLVRGAVPFESLQLIIDAELGGTEE